MTPKTAKLGDRLTHLPPAKYVFVGLVLLLLGMAVAHLYLLHGLTSLYLGLPLWLYLQIAVVAVMLGIAWSAIHVIAVTAEEEG